MRVAVFGLGEAGSRFAADLAARGVRVAAFDPAGVVTPGGVERCADPAAAVAGADLVLAITAAADAAAAAGQALHAFDPGIVYADLATGSPALKRSLAAIVGARGVAFADVALMATVPGRGLGTPSLVSGGGAARFVELLAPFGAQCEVVGVEPGEASSRKLLRSVYMKGLAAVVIEAMRGAEAAGHAAWLWDDMVREISEAGAPLLSRLVRGTAPHALRRRHEMEASATQLEQLGVPSTMTRSTIASLQYVLDHGLPPIPVVPDE